MAGNKRCVSQCVVRFVLSLERCILNEDFNAREVSYGCGTHRSVKNYPAKCPTESGKIQLREAYTRNQKNPVFK